LAEVASFENGELLPQSSRFQGELVARYEECTDVRNDR
jgi:hypothetical protein